MKQRGIRDHALGALILGFFTSAWFGWGQAEPPAGWSPWLTIGSIASILVAIPGGILSWKYRKGHTSLDAVRQTRYSVIVVIEIVLIAVGNAVLGVSDRSEWIPVWTCFIVGVHLVPFVPVFREPLYGIVGVLLVGVSAAALVVGVRSSIDPSAITGAGAGIVLFLVALNDLFHATRMTFDAT
ncbi:MAG TPA: hypothetical protein VNZ58_13985 [Thermomicrobiales bacterium]|nr:hypothetical protein [Thermomicrobiales bacterium]